MTETVGTERDGNDPYQGDEIEERIVRAYELFGEGNGEGALAECQAILDYGDVDAMRAARVAKLLGMMGQPAAETQIRDMVLARLSQEAESNPEDAAVQREAGLVFDYFDMQETAADYFRRALRIEPTEIGPAFQLTHYSLTGGDPDAAAEVWEPVLATAKDPGQLLLAVARMLGQFGFREKAEEVLARAEPLVGKRRTEFDFVAAGIRGESKDLDQHSMAVELFDSFASSYDEVLERLQNKGPFMIGRMLVDIGLSQDSSRDVLDAGCGTGLCAPYLRPFARHIVGIDISAKMLNACREKGWYDALSRTDLSVPATYPEGTFNLIVSSDVLVYFGDLGEVFSNIFARLAPGGWFIFTVEKALPPEPPVGFRLSASGRHVHTLEYIDRKLTDCGFGNSKRHFEDTIRNELGQPVAGLSIAAQKPALAVFG